MRDELEARLEGIAGQLRAGGAPSRRKLRGHTGWVMACAFSFCPDGRTIVSGSNDATLRLWCRT